MGDLDLDRRFLEYGSYRLSRRLEVRLGFSAIALGRITLYHVVRRREG
jgi:hypothetical protein